MTPTTSVISEIFQQMWSPFSHAAQQLGGSLLYLTSPSTATTHPLCADVAKPLWLMLITFVSLLIFVSDFRYFFSLNLLSYTCNAF